MTVKDGSDSGQAGFAFTRIPTFEVIVAKRTKNWKEVRRAMDVLENPERALYSYMDSHATPDKADPIGATLYGIIEISCEELELA